MTILLVDSTHIILENLLTQAGFKLENGTAWSREEILGKLPQYDGVVIRSRIPIDEAFFERANQLKCIGRFGAGLENIDLEKAHSLGIQCFNVPEGNRQAVGEHTLALLLNLTNHIRKADSQVRNGVWDRHGNTGTEISGKTVGIIGLGNMGQSFARVLQGFNVEIIAYDPYISTWPDTAISSVDIQELQERADIISIHTPLTEETRQWINASFWDRVKKSVYFINTARGPIVNTSDLLKAISSGKVRGAGLDVLEFENRSFHLQQDDPVYRNLISNEKVLLSPHVAGWTTEAFEKMGSLLANKMIRALLT